MTNKKTWLGMLVMVLVFGMTVIGCDTGNDNSSGIDNGGGLTYTVTYNTGGATGTPPEKVTVTAGSTINLHNGSGFSRTGYIFDGWYTIIAGTTSYYDATARYTVNSSVTFYAKWAYAYTVTFNLNGGSGTTPEPLIGGAGSEIFLPGGRVREGFTFGGWTENLSGSTKYNAGSSFTVTRNITMNAIWYLPGVFIMNAKDLNRRMYLSADGTCTIIVHYGGSKISESSGSYYIRDNLLTTVGVTYGGTSTIVNSDTLGDSGYYYYRQ